MYTVFTAALFTAGKRLGDPGCPSVGEELEKRRSVLTMGHG